MAVGMNRLRWFGKINRRTESGEPAMPDLEAVYESDTDQGKRRAGWRHALEEGKPVRLGRLPTQSEWWVPDPLISGFHATITWTGSHLDVAERNPPPTNKIFHRNQPAATFGCMPGESFVIGTTVFTLHAGGATFDPPNWADVGATIAAAAVASRQDLRKLPFEAPATAMRALESVADVLRLATDEDVLFQSMLTVVQNAVPTCDAAAIVFVPPESTDEQPRAIVRMIVERNALARERFSPSRRLADKAIRRERKSILYAWETSGLLESSKMTVAPDQRPGTPWAVCTPFQDGSNLGLYVAGRLPQPPEVKDKVITDRTLIEAQKVIELIASLIESTRKSHDLEKQLTLYRRFLPRRLWTETDRAKLDAILAPRACDVAVLFCDLRGSCRFAEDGSTDLARAWDQLSGALDEMSNTITAEDGIVAGFQGDAVMAFWGWPDPQPDAVACAAKAALRLRERFDREGWWSEFSCGIGIAFGTAVAGRLGAHDLAKVDVFGPTVNLASRLEGMTKPFGTRILIDPAAAKQLAAADPAGRRFRLRAMPAVRPVGMTADLAPFELLPPESAPGQPMKEVVRRSWDEAMAWYANGEWTKAKERLQAFFAKDPVAKMVLAAIGPNAKPAEGEAVVIPMTGK
jgi:class 3 adenylate cyclase